MAPGPVTAAAVAMGRRAKYAGAFIATGHAIIEVPLIIAIMLGMGTVLQSQITQILIGLVGGVVLLVMAAKMLAGSNNDDILRNEHSKTAPIAAGLILSAGNPYFLLWWATVGLALAARAAQFGIWVFVVFAVIHLLCDYGWLTTLSWAGFKGASLLAGRGRKIVLFVCSAALIVFGLSFIAKATISLFSRPA
ncbi:MAG TPA: LysE family transporter [Sedimentisphaerales bacterium]|nr:LysE family transporter [Sedimentisphaerales bacterium]